jgi:hypothetical protein
MGYRVDIYADGTASPICDSGAMGLSVHIPGQTVVQSRPITQEQFEQIQTQQQAIPGGLLTFDTDTGDFSVVTPS